MSRLKNTRRVHKAQREEREDEGLGVTSELPDAGRVQRGTQTAAHHPGLEGTWIESIPVFSQLWHAQLVKTAIHFLPSQIDREG